MIRITLFQHGALVTMFDDKASMATAYADWAQTCGYGMTIERLD